MACCALNARSDGSDNNFGTERDGAGPLDKRVCGGINGLPLVFDDRGDHDSRVQKVTAVTFCVTASGASTLRVGAERSDVQGKEDMEPSDAGGKTGVNGDLDAMARAPDARSGG